MSRLVAFDLDGTLIDTPRGIVDSFTAAFADLGQPAPRPDTIRSTIGLPLEKAFGTLLGIPTDDVRVMRGIELYQQRFRELVLPRAAALVFPGVAVGLTTLRARGTVLAVATSKFHASAVALLRAAGLWNAFHLVVGADQVTQPKPHPEMALHLLRHFDVAAGAAVMVGDTTHDLLMAKAAGMRALGVTYGVHSRAELESAAPLAVDDTFADVVTRLLELDSQQKGTR